MQMLYALAAVLTAVGNDAIAVLKSEFLCHSRNRLKNLCHVQAVFCRDCVRAVKMLLRNKQHVHGCHGRDIVERVNVLVLVNLF